MTETSPRIAIVVNQFPAGSEPCIVRKLLHLLERGWDAHVVCKRRDDRQWDFFPQLAADPAIRRRVHTNRDLEHELRTLKPQLVSFESGGSLLQGIAQVRDELDAKLVVGFRGSDIKVYGRDDPTSYAHVWAAADAYHVVADHRWEDAVRRGAPADAPHAVIPSAIDDTLFVPITRTHDEVLGSVDRPLRLLSVGRLHWVKGYDYALRAVRALLDAGLAVEYRIMGEGDHRQSVLFDIYDLELEKTVQLLGACEQSEVRRSMAWADVLLHASLSEGSPNTLLEAFATDLPILATDATGVLETVGDDAAHIVPRRDWRAIADGLTALAASPAERTRLAENGRAALHRAATLEEQMDAFEAFYRKTLAAVAS